ncbi:MAG TPA: glycosyltransferase family 2 protein [Roseiarcus sp.]|nr:glycosyltransferase family 2 protein [Roseiarcus sp.]
MPAAATPSRPTLSVIVPTYREAANVPRLFERLAVVLEGLPWEMVVVDDDSSDGTYDVAFAIARRDPRLRCLRRVNRIGLAGAVIEGWLASSADFVAVIDGDLQHDEAVLPQMYAALERGDGNLAIGSRIPDPTKPGGLSPARQKLSDLGKWFFSLVSGVDVSDPMSGFFMTRRDIVAKLAPRLSPDGFKILVDLILSSRHTLKAVEIPYVFRPRSAGESKLSPLVGLDFLGLVTHHASGGALPVRFVLFAMIGGVGLVVHLAVLWLLIGGSAPRDFTLSQIGATVAAMASNFVLNNEITYRNRRYRGVSKITGFLIFSALCGIGAIANVNIANLLYHAHRNWGPGGMTWEIIAGMAGAIIGVVWNYAASNTFVWRNRRKS